MHAFAWILTIVGSVLGMIALAGALLAGSAPQQAALAAIAVGFAVLPYCVARAVTELRRGEPSLRRTSRELSSGAASDLQICSVCSRSSDAHQAWCSVGQGQPRIG